jgi:flagellar export protein FliJ
MKTFHFPLQRVLEYRELQMRTEEEKLSTIQNQLAQVLHRENALTAAQLNAEMNLLGRAVVDASEFRALSAFQLRIRSEKVSLLTARNNLETQIAGQRKRLLKARKDCKVLENLKERRKKAWTYLSDREIETPPPNPISQTGRDPTPRVRRASREYLSTHGNAKRLLQVARGHPCHISEQAGTSSPDPLDSDSV